jgi:hypothetical protein
MQSAVQEWVSSKETTSGRLVRKLHVPREIMRAARLKGMAFTVYSPIRVLGLGDLDNAKVDGTINPPRQGQGVARLLGGIAYSP